MIPQSHGGLAAAASLLFLALAPVRAADETGWHPMGRDIPTGDGRHADADARANNEDLRCQGVDAPPPVGTRAARPSNFQKTGSKATWTVQCGGKMPMTGVGEMTFDGSNSYTGTVKFDAKV